MSARALRCAQTRRPPLPLPPPKKNGRAHGRRSNGRSRALRYVPSYAQAEALKDDGRPEFTSRTRPLALFMTNDRLSGALVMHCDIILRAKAYVPVHLTGAHPVIHCIALRCVALRCVALRCVASRRVASRRVVSCRVMSCRVVSCCVVLCCVVLCCVVLRCVVLCCVVLCCRVVVLFSGRTFDAQRRCAVERESE